MGHIDFKGCAQSVTKKDIHRLNSFSLEKMMYAIREENKRSNRGPICRQILVMDMDQLPLKQITNKSGSLRFIFF